MCTGIEPALIGAAVAAAGTGASIYNTNRVASRQDAAAADGIRRQGVLQQEADRASEGAIRKITESDPNAEQQGSLGQYLQVLKSNQGQTGAGFGNGISDAYDSLAGDNLNTVNSQATQRAGTLSRIDAPTYQRIDEGRTAGDLASYLGTVKDSSGTDAYLTSLRLSGIRRNPYFDLASEGLRAGGRLAAGAGAGGGGNTLSGTGEFALNSGQSNASFLSDAPNYQLGAPVQYDLSAFTGR